MSSTSHNIRRVVMRRVYTMVAARLVSHPLTLQAALFATALMVFAELVHIERIVTTLQAMSLSQVPTFILNALMRGEVVTLVALGVLTMTALSMPWQFKKLVVPRFHTPVTS